MLNSVNFTGNCVTSEWRSSVLPIFQTFYSVCIGGKHLPSHARFVRNNLLKRTVIRVSKKSLLLWCRLSLVHYLLKKYNVTSTVLVIHYYRNVLRLQWAVVVSASVQGVQGCLQTAPFQIYELWGGPKFCLRTFKYLLTFAYYCIFITV